MDAVSAIQMNLQSVMQSVNISLLRKEMDADAQAAAGLLSQMEAANPAVPGFGHTFFARV